MDPPITELGQQQSEILAKNQATDAIQDLISSAVPGSARALVRNGYGVTSLFCSPMLGSLQAAHLVQEALGLIPEVGVDIHERGGMFLDHGEGRGSVSYPGMARSEISAKYPNYQLPPGIAGEGCWDRGREDLPTACVSAKPNGMSLAELRDAWAPLSERTDIVGFDLVEVNPQLDIGTGITSYSAAHTVVEFLGPICAQPRWAARREGGLHALGVLASIHEKTWEPAGP